jgi:hypothetical protein
MPCTRDAPLGPSVRPTTPPVATSPPPPRPAQLIHGYSGPLKLDLANAEKTSGPRVSWVEPECRSAAAAASAAYRLGVYAAKNWDRFAGPAQQGAIPARLGPAATGRRSSGACVDMRGAWIAAMRRPPTCVSTAGQAETRRRLARHGRSSRLSPRLPSTTPRPTPISSPPPSLGPIKVVHHWPSYVEDDHAVLGGLAAALEKAGCTGAFSVLTLSRDRDWLCARAGLARGLGRPGATSLHAWASCAVLSARLLIRRPPHEAMWCCHPAPHSATGLPPPLSPHAVGVYTAASHERFARRCRGVFYMSVVGASVLNLACTAEWVDAARMAKTMGFRNHVAAAIWQATKVGAAPRGARQRAVRNWCCRRGLHQPDCAPQALSPSARLRRALPLSFWNALQVSDYMPTGKSPIPGDPVYSWFEVCEQVNRWATPGQARVCALRRRPRLGGRRAGPPWIAAPIRPAPPTHSPRV